MRRIVLLLGACCLTSGVLAPAPQYDIIIRGGTVIDGTGAAPFRADVGVVGKHIARIGNLANAKAAAELDATGLNVAPGFINLHSHASPSALASAENMITQGVTLEILNADGGGPADIGKQLTDIAASGLAVNVGANAGFNSAWASVVGDSDRRPTPDEVRTMREILAANLERGAWGVSAGLDYKPAYFSTTEEVIDVVQAARPYRTVFTNHDRITPESNFSSKVGMAETMAIGARAGLVPLITHMKVQGREQGSAGAFLKTMSAATAQGRFTAADAYPYLAGQSGLGALIIPGWAQDGGREKMLERFRDPALRAKIVAEAEEAMAARFGGPQGVYMPASKRELTDVMKELGVSGGEALVRVLEKDNTGAILRFGIEEDLVKILQHPTTSIACDCGAVLPGRASHPRYYGTFPRVLGRYVRETRALTWPDAIRKMTLLPAATIGLVDRGAIAVGMAADITVFDPATVIDHATFEEPTLKSDGIRHVIVNGTLALRDGVVTGQQGGQVLLRSKNMPSRPLDLTRRRRVVIESQQRDSAALAIRVDVSQAPSEHRATGSFRLAPMSSDDRLLRIESIELGVLQTTADWATLTGWVRTAGGDGPRERAMVAVFEKVDPWDAERRPLVTVVFDGDAARPMRQYLSSGGAVRISH
jgi:N-acyl-D-aspartate/D-glutamate deacylase